jgi:transcriptional regulator with XRE-family HTH domain
MGTADRQPLHSLRALRIFLGYRQKELAGYLGIPENTFKALELGYRRLTTKMAARISAASGVSQAWLLRNRRGEPILSESGKPFSVDDFERAQAFSDVKLAEGSYLLRLERMEFAQVYFLLLAIADSYGDDFKGKNGFKKRLEHFMRHEEIKRPELHEDLAAFRASRGPLGAKSWLFPRDSGIFDVLIEELRNNKRALLLHLRSLS